MSVTLHTEAGDLKIEVHCDLVPRAAENFLALCASGAYDGCAWHRSIPGFMVQTGCPLGTGKGGTSIWGGPFPVGLLLRCLVSWFVALLLMSREPLPARWNQTKKDKKQGRTRFERSSSTRSGASWPWPTRGRIRTAARCVGPLPFLALLGPAAC